MLSPIEKYGRDALVTSINNHMYNELADSWWDEDGPLHLLKVMVNPWRLPYFADALWKIFGADLSRARPTKDSVQTGSSPIPVLRTVT